MTTLTMAAVGTVGMVLTAVKVGQRFLALLYYYNDPILTLNNYIKVFTFTRPSCTAIHW